MKTKLEQWKHPENYAGAVWPGYRVFLTQNRDSDALTRSNFERGFALIGGESETVQVVRERHWACGWVEWIGIHEDNAEAIAKAEAILEKLDGYPVLDDDHFSELEWNEAHDTWEGLSLRERVDLCKTAGLSIFAARNPDMPRDDSGYIFESLRG
jgi:hypothetical protein